MQKHRAYCEHNRQIPRGNDIIYLKSAETRLCGNSKMAMTSYLSKTVETELITEVAGSSSQLKLGTMQSLLHFMSGGRVHTTLLWTLDNSMSIIQAYLLSIIYCM